MMERAFLERKSSRAKPQIKVEVVWSAFYQKSRNDDMGYDMICYWNAPAFSLGTTWMLWVLTAELGE